MGKKAKVYDSVMIALRDTIQKQREEINALRAEKKTPADYSLGFVNGLIFVEARLSSRRVANFETQNTSVGALPYPQGLKTKEELELEAELQARMDKIVDAARILAQAFKADPTCFIDCAPDMEALHIALKNLDNMMEEIESATPSPEPRAEAANV